MGRFLRATIKKGIKYSLFILCAAYLASSLLPQLLLTEQDRNDYAARLENRVALQTQYFSRVIAVPLYREERDPSSLWKAR